MKATNLKDYAKEIDAALEDDFLRQAMDNFATAYPVGRAKSFEGMDFRGLIQRIADNKAEAISRMDELFIQFKEQAEKKGTIVHLAKTAQEANEIIARIAKDNNCKTIIKSKSMTSEETQLNTALQAENLEVTETDLGEWIIQHRHEGPSHMVMPAIHLARGQVADLFSKITNIKQSDNIDSLVKVARTEIRAKFIEADMGITGANFAISETGTIGVCTNEGNARLSSTLPRVHVAICGLDKLCPSIGDALDIIDVLPRNATGQTITSYVTWITGSNQCQTTDDKKKVMHIVFLDNGRSAIAKDPIFSEAMRCVRCGACANVCPVYRLVGGHTMGYIYIGAIGLILTYLYHGRDKARALAQNCINCGACKDICAAGIDLPRLITEVRVRLNDEEGTPADVSLLSKVMKNRKLFHSLLKFAKFSQRPLTGGGETIRHLPSIFAKKHGFKTLPALAKKSFRDMWNDIKPMKPANPKVKIALFAGCAQDFIYPDQLKAALKIFAAHNVEVEFPMNQTCCGLPVQMMGEAKVTQDIAEQNIKAIDAIAYDYIVTLCASCASHLSHAYPDAVQSAEMKTNAERFSAKVIDFSSFCKNVLGLSDENFVKGKEKISHHAPCHLCRGMGIIQEPKDLIGYVGEYVEAKEYDSCCGFGGSYSVKFPAISKGILERKTANFKETGATTVVTDCPGCIMQLRGGSEKMNGGYKVRHIAEILAENLKS